MKKVEISLITKIALIFVFCLLDIQIFYAQCTNPDPTGSSLQNFCDSDRSSIADLNATGGTIVWFDAAVGGTQYLITDRLLDTTIYYADDVDAGGCSPNRLEVTVVINGMAPEDVDPYVGKCAIEAPKISGLSATGSNIKWFDAQTGGSQLNGNTLLVNGSIYWVQQTENGCTSDRVPTLVSLIDQPAPTVAIEQFFCSSPVPTVADLVAVESDILWYASENADDLLTTDIQLVDGQDYWAAQNSFPCESVVRTQTTVTIDIAPDAGVDSSFVECEINLVTTNLFDILGGSPDTTGTWTGPSILTGGYLGTFEPGTNIEGIYTYSVSSILGLCPPSAANVTVVITQIPPPGVSETIQTFCEIDNPIVSDIAATGSNLVWYDTETSPTPIDPTESLVNAEDYWGAQVDPTSGCESALRTSVTVSIIAPPAPTTTNPNPTFCEAENTTISMLDISGSGVLWYDTAISTTPLDPTGLLVDGEDYWASQTDATSGCESATRQEINVTVISEIPPTTTEPNQEFCEIEMATIGDLNITGINIVWYDTETSTVQLSETDLLVNGEDYWAAENNTVSGCESKIRVQINTIVGMTAAPSVASSTQSFCVIDHLPGGPTIAEIDITGTAIQWYDTETSTTPLNGTDLLVDGEDYWASQTDAISGCESAVRVVVTTEVSDPPAPTTSNANQNFCVIQNATISMLDVTGNSVQWYDTVSSTTPLISTDLLVDGEDYWATQTDAISGCESATRLMVSVSIFSENPPTTSEPIQTFCEVEMATISSLNLTGNNTLWYDTNTSTVPLNDTDLLVDGEDYYATSTNGITGCESEIRLQISAVILVTPPPTTSSANQIFCVKDYQPAVPVISDLDISGDGIIWYDSETSTTPLNTSDVLVNARDYWATQTDIVTGCESAIRLLITATVINPPTPTTGNINQLFCLVQSPTVADLQASGTLIIWYDTEISTTPLNASDLLVDGEDYWAADSDSTTGCESISRLMVMAAIADTLPPTIAIKSQSFCASDMPTFADIAISGTNIDWYDTETSTTPLDPTELLADGQEYWATQTDSTTGCASSVRESVSVAVTNIATPVLSSTGNQYCSLDNPTLDDVNNNVTVASGESILWFDAYPNGSPLTLFEPLIDGTTYYALASDSNGCLSTAPLMVTVDLGYCDHYDIEIYDGFSPQGDGINDTFKIELSRELYPDFRADIQELYPDFRVEFFNRWGAKVYTADAGSPDWNGRLHGTKELVPAGVYYFIIYFNKNGKKPIQRRLYLSR